MKFLYFFALLGVFCATGAFAQQATPDPANTSPAVDVAPSVVVTPPVVVAPPVVIPPPAAPTGSTVIGIKIPVTSAGISAHAAGLADLVSKAVGGGVKARLELDSGTDRNWATINGNFMSDYSFATNSVEYTGALKTSAIPFQDLNGNQLLEIQPVDLEISKNAVTAPGYGAAFTGGLFTNTGVHVKTTPSSNQSNYFTVAAKPFSLFTDRTNSMQSLDGLNAINIRAEHNFASWLRLRFDGTAGLLSWLSNGTSTQTGVGRYLAANLTLQGEIPKINLELGLALIADDISYKYANNSTAVVTQVDEADARAMFLLGVHFDVGTRPAATQAPPASTPAPTGSASGAAIK